MTSRGQPMSKNIKDNDGLEWTVPDDKQQQDEWPEHPEPVRPHPLNDEEARAKGNKK